jgi:hypothetical protein
MENALDTLHNVSCFIGALASASEQTLGMGSLSICSLAGKKFGASVVEGELAITDPLEAIAFLRDALKKRGIVWDFEPFAGEKDSPIEEKDGKTVIRLIFRTCMVRNALFRYAHEQKQSLCYMSHGVFAGAMEKICSGKKATLEIVHAGPNACLKELVLENAS